MTDRDHARYRSLTSYKSAASSTIQESFALTQTERDMLRYKMQNERVVGFYKKVLGDIRTVLHKERQ